MGWFPKRPAWLTDRFFRNMPLAMMVILVSFGYAFDLDEGEGFVQALLNSFYMTIISLTTIGYGDYSPTTSAGKLASLPVMELGTQLASLSMSHHDDFRDLEDNDEKSPQKKDIKIK